MGGASSISIKDNNKQSKLITFYNMDLPSSQSQQSMRITEQTTINNIITYIKEKQGVQNLTLYYEQFRIDDNSFFLYECLDILPTRVFGYRINQQEQISQQKTQQISQQKTQQISQQNTQQIPQQNTQQIPQQNTQQIPQQNTQQISQQNTQQIPQQNTQQFPKQNIQVVQNDKKQYQSNNQSSQSQTVQNQKNIQNQSTIHPTSEKNQQIKTPQKNNSNNEQKYTSQIIYKSQNNAEVEKPIENSKLFQRDNLIQEQNQILNYLLKQAICKYQKTQVDYDKIKQDYIQLKQDYERLQQDNNYLKQYQEMQDKKYQLQLQHDRMQQQNNQFKSQILQSDSNDKNKEIQQKSSITIYENVNMNTQIDISKQSNFQEPSQNQIQQTQTIDNNQRKLKNQCGHYLDEQRVYDIIKEALVSKNIAKCDQCGSKLSHSILNQIDSIGKAYKEFQFNQEINQLMINLKSQNKYLIKQCSSNFCYFYCIFDEKYKKSQNYYCPQCLNSSMVKID
ncbi:unnamed protein product [Paramecium pentaurelia]|uniref:Ubiquitin-like domain-containing protein n=1 Tax=Paramecium pentaurelia TaxID=43138 RepID=A0A8S1SSW8_9CILI|nr:unnamed protein product [Paramecium pentaurelia]